jgi:hypothetical protein
MGVGGFVGKAGTATGTGAEDLVKQVVQFATRYQSMACFVATAPPTGTTITFTLRLNNADTGLTCPITGPANTGTNTIQAPGVIISPGDTVDVLVGAGTPSAPGSFALGG